MYNGYPRATQGIPKGYPRDTQGLPKGYPRDTQGIPKGYPRDTQGIPKGYPRDTQGIPKGYPRDTQGIPKGYPRDTQGIPKGYPRDTQGIPKGYPREQHRRNAFPTPSQRRRNTVPVAAGGGAVPSAPRRSDEVRCRRALTTSHGAVGTPRPTPALFGPHPLSRSTLISVKRGSWFLPYSERGGWCRVWTCASRSCSLAVCRSACAAALGVPLKGCPRRMTPGDSARANRLAGRDMDIRCGGRPGQCRSEEHTSELQSPCNIVCRLLLE